MNSIWVCEHHNRHFGVLGLIDRVVARLANRGLVGVDMHLSYVAVAMGMEIYGFKGFAASIVIRFIIIIIIIIWLVGMKMLWIWGVLFLSDLWVEKVWKAHGMGDSEWNSFVFDLWVWFEDLYLICEYGLKICVWFGGCLWLLWFWRFVGLGHWLGGMAVLVWIELGIVFFVNGL